MCFSNPFFFYSEPRAEPRPPCGCHRGNIPLALRQLRSLVPWPKTPLSQLDHSPVAATLLSHQRPSSWPHRPASCTSTCKISLQLPRKNASDQMLIPSIHVKSCRKLGMVPLVPSGSVSKWSLLDATRRRLVLSGTRLPEPSPASLHVRFSGGFCFHSQFLQALIRVSKKRKLSGLAFAVLTSAPSLLNGTGNLDKSTLLGKNCSFIQTRARQRCPSTLYKPAKDSRSTNSANFATRQVSLGANSEITATALAPRNCLSNDFSTNTAASSVHPNQTTLQHGPHPTKPRHCSCNCCWHCCASS